MTRPGWVRVDCHLHTVASGDAVLTLEQLAERARQAGLDVVCITDHNVTAAAVAAAERGIWASGSSSARRSGRPDGDVIGLFLTERIPYVLPLAEVVARIRAQGGLVYVPHPFDPGRSSLGAVLPGLCEAGDVDIIEVVQRQDRRPGAERPGGRAGRGLYGLPGGAGSDAHDPPGVGAAYLEMPDFDGPAGFLAALRAGADHRRVPPARHPVPAPRARLAAALGSRHRPMRVARRSRW